MNTNDYLLEFQVIVDGQEYTQGGIKKAILEDFSEEEFDNGIKGFIFIDMCAKLYENREEMKPEVIEDLMGRLQKFFILNEGKWYKEHATILPEGVEIIIT